ncbi:PHD finger protein rhinoceros-like isoform X2 [Homarus americanus]|uniref:PHD finger protein rhinoceros-like isoform X2 n=1 Tax=Homarus americanus TaxID=6706 RepID=UPI001C443F56|nr:PHD finger protein rhinoceros-like isoform X2 [Homarus americanus]
MVGVRARGAVWALGGAYAPPVPSGHNTLLDIIGGQPGGPPLDGASLTVALDVVQAWAVLITVGFTLVLFIFLAFCVCAKKDDGYDEFEMSHGITTVKVCHDGGENGLGSYPRINGSNTPRASDEASEASSRCTLKRELPAIPLSAQPDPSAIECNVERTQSQHSSDLYAAVGEANDGGSGIGKVIGGVQVLPAGAIGLDGRAAIIRDPTLTSPTDPSAPSHIDGGAGSGTAAHPYAKVKKNHPYAHVKLPKKDHPYAKVVRDDSEDPETDTDNYDDPKAITKDKSSGWDSEGGYEPAPPVPEKRFDLEEETATGPPDGGLMTTSVTSASSGKGPSSPRSPHLNTRSSMVGSAPSPTSPHSIGAVSDRPPSTEIQAALAISGRTPANEEMPYMTPPLHHQPEEAGIEIPSQQNFSGDSQDSRGYTSISVREPLSAIKAQTQGSAAPQSSATTQPLEGEGYYMTVSDDSADEMYACIYEGTRGVGSETYAQIEPRSTPPPPPPPMPSPPHAPSTPSPLSTRGGSQPPPAPPSVDSLRHVVHSRQASSSSAASTVMGSPGAEKRGTRSPLPPLPQGDTSLYSGPSPQPPHSPPRSVPPIERPTQRALEEMYAKVMKKQRPGHSRGDSSGGGGESDAGSVSSSRRGSVDIGGARWGSHASSPPTTPRQSVDLGSMTRSLVETRNHEVVTSISRAKSYEKAGVWGSTTQHPQPSLPNPNYETIPQLSNNFYSGGSSDPGYETVKNSEPPYASVERPEENYPGYETVKQTSDIESEPGYETLKHREYEPGYETVTGEAKLESSEPGYETVAHEKHQEEYEPGYETVTHHRAETSDPGYEIVKGKATSEFGDPGYEELQGAIHHTRTTSEHDPNYEQLKFTSRRSSDGDAEPGYEVVKKVETESTYEFVRDYDTQENYPPYEKIDKPGKEISQRETPLYASVQKGSLSQEKKLAKDKSPEEDKSPKATGLLESDIDTCPPPPISPKDFKEGPTKDDFNKDKDLTLPLKKLEEDQQVLPPEKISPPLVAVKSPDKGSPSSVKSLNGSPPMVKSPKGSPPLVKSPKGSPPLVKSPKGSPPATKSPKGSPPLVKSPKGSPPLVKIAKGSPPQVTSPKGSPPLMKSPKGSPPLMKSPDKGSPPATKSPKGSPPLMKSPKGSPPLMKSPKGSPPMMKSPKGSPPMMKSPKGSPPMMKSPDKGSPPLMKSPQGSPRMMQSPDKETPPMMKSPSPDMDTPPMMKSPKGSPPLMKSPKGSPPMAKSPDRETPPLTRSPSPDIDFSPTIRDLGRGSPVMTPVSSTADAPLPPPPPPPPPASEETETSTLIASLDTEPLQQDESPDKEVSPTEVSHPAQETPPPPPPPHLESSVIEQPTALQESQHPQPSQQVTQSPEKEVVPSLGGTVVEQFVPMVNENRNEIIPCLSGVEIMPIQPPTPEREASPVAFSSLGSEDLPAPLSIDDTENQPQETINPLYMIDKLDNDVQHESALPAQEEVIAEGQDTPSGMCGELPPPPPLVMDEDDSAFTNDLPPPIPESSPLMQRTSTLCEDTPPPPLVPPSDVEGLDELLNLANMGSSSSGSTAGQPGSIHGSSEKDSDSPQESDVIQMEGTMTADELPPPPPLSEPSEPGTEHDSDEELDNSVSSGYECGFTAGGITVTVNPMVDVEETPESPVHVAPPPPSEPSQAAPPSPIVSAAIGISSGGSQSSSSGSGSQDTGSGSVESVVTVECAVAADAGTQGRQQSSDSSSSPESRHLDPHEQITEV